MKANPLNILITSSLLVFSVATQANATQSCREDAALLQELADSILPLGTSEVRFTEYDKSKPGEKVMVVSSAKKNEIARLVLEAMKDTHELLLNNQCGNLPAGMSLKLSMVSLCNFLNLALHFTRFQYKSHQENYYAILRKFVAAYGGGGNWDKCQMTAKDLEVDRVQEFY